MKLLLFSDLHLDSQFSWLGVAGEAGGKRRQALRETLRRIVRVAQDEGVDGLLCGGDLYEHQRVSPDTAALLQSVFAGLQPIRVFLAPGNHDWYGPGSVYQRVKWSSNVHVFRSNRLEPVELTDGVTLWGAAHCVPAGTPGFLDGFQVGRTGVHLALFHGSERGWFSEQGGDKQLHAPFSENAIEAASFTHAFLGHYHRPKDGLRHTYPGNPDPLTFGEDGERGIVLVTIDDIGNLSRERRCVAVSRLHDVEVDISGCGHQQDVRDRIATGIQMHRGLVRITLKGEIAADLDLGIAKLSESFPDLEGVLIRLGRIRPSYDTERLKEEQTVRGQFVRDVSADAGLSDEQRHKVLLMGLRALEGRGDLEVF